MAAGFAAWRIPGTARAQTFGTTSDSLRDHTAAIQAAIDAAIAEKRPLRLDRHVGPFNVGRLVVSGSVDIDLGNNRLILNGQAAGFFLSGDIERFRIANGEIIGDGRLASNHHGILTSAVSDETSICRQFEATNLTISNVVCGMRVDGIRKAVFRNVHISHTVGIHSGNGYGIAFATKGESTEPESVVIDNCSFHRTTRHGLYVAGARNVCIFRTTWTQHAPDELDTHGRSALAISRSQNVQATDLTFTDCSDECIGIDDDEGGYTTRKIALSRIFMKNCRSTALRIGVAAPWVDGQVEVSDITIENLRLSWDLAPLTYPIKIQEVSRLKMENIALSSDTGQIGGLICFPPNAPHRDFIALRNLSAEIPDHEWLVAVPAAIQTDTTHLSIHEVRCPQGIPILLESCPTRTNPNLQVSTAAIVLELSGAQPALSDGERFLVRQKTRTTIEALSGARIGRTVELIFGDDLTTLDPMIFKLRDRRLLSPKTGARIALTFDGSSWTG